MKTWEGFRTRPRSRGKNVKWRDWDQSSKLGVFTVRNGESLVCQCHVRLKCRMLKRTPPLDSSTLKTVIPPGPWLCMATGKWTHCRTRGLLLEVPKAAGVQFPTFESRQGRGETKTHREVQRPLTAANTSPGAQPFLPSASDRHTFLGSWLDFHTHMSLVLQ